MAFLALVWTWELAGGPCRTGWQCHSITSLLGLLLLPGGSPHLPQGCRREPGSPHPAWCPQPHGNEAEPAVCSWGWALLVFLPGVCSTRGTPPRGSGSLGVPLLPVPGASVAEGRVWGRVAVPPAAPGAPWCYLCLSRDAQRP